MKKNTFSFSQQRSVHKNDKVTESKNEHILLLINFASFMAMRKKTQKMLFFIITSQILKKTKLSHVQDPKNKQSTPSRPKPNYCTTEVKNASRNQCCLVFSNLFSQHAHVTAYKVRQ